MNNGRGPVLVVCFALVLNGSSAVGMLDFMQKTGTIIIDKFWGSCPGYKNLPVVYPEMKITSNEDGQLLLNTTIIVKENVNGKLGMELSIQKCERANKDECTVLHRMKSNKYCETIISDSDSILHQFFTAVKPQWKCPLKKGTYKAVNGVFDVSTLLLLASSDHYWKIKSHTFELDTKKSVICIQGEGHVDDGL